MLYHGWMLNQPWIVLVEPQFAFNVGMTARVMRNFGFSTLVLMRPACDPQGTEAVQFSMKGREVLRRARRVDRLDDLKEEGMFLIGTTRQGGRYRSRRLLPWELAAVLRGNPTCALVFGNESRGLTTAEIRLMDGLATLPAARGEEGSLNLSMAVGVFLYELTREVPDRARAPLRELELFGDRLVRRLQASGVFASGDYRHGPARLQRIIKELRIGPADVRFLHALIKALEKKQ